MKVILTIFIARLIGPIEFGKYSIILTIASIVSLVMLFGSHNFILVKISNNKYKKFYITIFKKYYIWLTILIFITTLIFATFISILNPMNLALFVSINFYFFAIQYFFVLDFKYKNLLIFNSVYYIFFLFCILNSEFVTLEKIIFYNWISEIICILLFLEISYTKTLFFSKKELKILFYQYSIAKKTFVIDIQNILMQRLDYIFISIIASGESFGIFAAARNISEGLLFIPKTLQPFILQSMEPKRLKKIVIFALLFLSLGVLIISFIPNEIMRFAYNDKYISDSHWLQLSVISVYMYSLILLSNSKNIVYGLFKKNIKGNFLSIVIIIFSATIITIYKISEEYIAISTIISFIISTMYLNLWNKRIKDNGVKNEKKI